MDTLQIAKVCHQANKAYCESQNDYSQQDWDSAHEWQKNSAVAGVKYLKDNPDATPENMHESWSAQKLADGWKHGPEKNAVLKTHPCLVPFDQLPEFQQKKDILFSAIVNALS